MPEVSYFQSDCHSAYDCRRPFIDVLAFELPDHSGVHDSLFDEFIETQTR